jgi:uncharacterized membrane protein (DUF106 family)
MIGILTAGIILGGLAYAGFSILMQRKLAGVDKMYEIRAHMNHKTKELIAMSKNKEAPEKLSAKQRELTELSMQSMKNQMKPMIVILPVLAVIEYLILPNVFAGTNFSINLLGFTLGYQLTFFVVIFVTGIVLSIALSVFDRRRLKDKYNFGLIQPSHKEPQQESQQPVQPAQPQ